MYRNYRTFNFFNDNMLIIPNSNIMMQNIVRVSNIKKKLLNYNI